MLKIIFLQIAFYALYNVVFLVNLHSKLKITVQNIQT